MDTKKTIRKILIITMWLAIGSGMITLLAAAIRNQKAERCSDFRITINGAKDNLFVDEKDIAKLLATGTNGNIKGQPRSAFDLMKLEKLLEENVWVRDAELYFDNKDVLHVTVREREPVARVFSITGKTFYIDPDEKQMPLSGKRNARVPVFTGFPVKKVIAKKDKQLLHDVRSLAEFISNDPFWSSQVAQIDITTEAEFEMIPVVGNHVVKLGNGENIEAKFHRLFVFYKNVLSQAGFDKYKIIDVQYAGQVIGVKGNESKVDSVQLRRSVEKLLQQARHMQYDTTMPVAPVIAKPSIEASTEAGPVNNSPATSLNKPSSPNPVKSILKPAETVTTLPKPMKKEPKALMPKRER